jgi:hypothetical protein
MARRSGSATVEDPRFGKFGLLSPRLFGYRHVRVPQVAQTIIAFVFRPSIVDCVCPRLFALALLRSKPRRSGGGRRARCA